MRIPEKGLETALALSKLYDIPWLGQGKGSRREEQRNRGSPAPASQSQAPAIGALNWCPTGSDLQGNRGLWGGSEGYQESWWDGGCEQEAPGKLWGQGAVCGK